MAAGGCSDPYAMPKLLHKKLLILLYIAFTYYNEITIIHTLSGKRIDITKENIKTKEYHETYFIDNLHWINDHLFTFLDKTNERYTDKHIILKYLRYFI